MNRPFPSSLVPLFQSEAKCETILMKMTFICMKKKLRAELIFIWKVLHLDSLWNRGTRKLGNGLFYVRVARTISHSFASLNREILFLTRKHKINIFEPTCNQFFLLYGEKIQEKQKAGIVTSLNDTTRTKVTYGKYATRVPDEVAYGIYERFSSQ